MKFENFIHIIPALIFILLNGFQLATSCTGTIKKKSSFSFKKTFPLPSSSRSSSFKASPSNPVGSTSFRSTSSLNSQDSFGSARSSNKETVNERIHYVPVENPSMFLSNMNELAVLEDQNTEIRLEVQEPYYCGFCETAVKRALQRMREQDVAETAKEELIALLKSNRAFRVPYENEAWLTRFLRLKDYNVADTYDLVQKYYIFKATHKKLLYDDIVPELLTDVFQKEIWVVMPNRDQYGRRTIIFQAKNWNLDEVKIEDILRVAVLLGEASSYEPITQIMGVQFIIDMDGLSRKHFSKIGRKYAEIIMDYLQYCAPFKLELFHIINESWLVKLVVQLFRLFAKDVVHGKAKFHGPSWKKLHNYFRREDLPDIYGGLVPLPKISTNEWTEILRCGSQEYSYITSYGVAIPSEDEQENDKEEEFSLK